MKNSICVVEKFNVASIIEQIVDSGLKNDAFYVCNLQDIVIKYKEFVTKFPRLKPYYPIGCNDHWSVLSTLAALGSCFACASRGEVEKILSLGIDKSTIIYSNLMKAPSHIKFAAENDVDLMMFDNETELYKIKTHFSSARLILDIQSVTADIQDNTTLKFGCNPLSEAPELLSLAKNLGLNVIGVGFHMSSDSGDIFQRDIARARQVFDCANEIGFNLNSLYIRGEMFPDLINDSLNEYFPETNIDIIAEFGKYFVASAFTLACSIQSYTFNKDIAENAKKEDKIHFVYYINDGVYHSFSVSKNEPDRRKCIPLRIRKDAKYFNSRIWGQSLDSIDVIVDNQNMPELKTGDWIYFENFGAYTLTITTAFNGFAPIKILTCVDENTCQNIFKTLPKHTMNMIKLENILQSTSDEFLLED